MRDCDDIQFREISVSRENIWCGKQVSEIGQSPEMLIILIKRNGNVVIPEGSTVIREKDVLVLHSK